MPSLRAAWLRHQVLRFPNQPLTKAALCAVARAFGPSGSDPYLKGLPDHPQIVEVKRAANEQAPPFGSSWHSDWSFEATPPAATLLHARVIPPVGGDTCFADGYRAYEALPQSVAERLPELVAVHSARRPYSRSGFAAGGGAERSMCIIPSDRAYETVEHPVLRTHPETHRTALWINPAYVIDLRGPTISAGEAPALIAELCAHLQAPRFQYRLRWAPETLALWDNRCVSHCAQGGYDGHQRLLYRTTIAGDRPRYHTSALHPA